MQSLLSQSLSSLLSPLSSLSSNFLYFFLSHQSHSNFNSRPRCKASIPSGSLGPNWTSWTRPSTFSASPGGPWCTPTSSPTSWGRRIRWNIFETLSPLSLLSILSLSSLSLFLPYFMGTENHVKFINLNKQFQSSNTFSLILSLSHLLTLFTLSSSHFVLPPGSNLSRQSERPREGHRAPLRIPRTRSRRRIEPLQRVDDSGTNRFVFKRFGTNRIDFEHFGSGTIRIFEPSRSGPNQIFFESSGTSSEDCGPDHLLQREEDRPPRARPRGRGEGGLLDFQLNKTFENGHFEKRHLKKDKKTFEERDSWKWTFRVKTKKRFEEKDSLKWTVEEKTKINVWRKRQLKKRQLKMDISRKETLTKIHKIKMLENWYCTVNCNK